jgi:probable phosphoglycerate mutase
MQEQSMKTELIMVRHGQSESNAGLSEDPDCGLTELGQQQARLAGRLMAAHDLAEFVALVSPYRRARQTAAGIAEVTGLKFEVEELVREWPWTGPADIQGKLYHLEPVEELVERLREFLRRYEGRKVFVVSHAGPIAVLTQLAWGETIDPHKGGAENGRVRWLRLTGAHQQVQGVSID